ncbi:MAG: hypothetical protein KF869_06155 [Phycisphaeraceae bacterium]|nr:hypothetical protein [Phycisphaeraceae bacterium]
MQRGTQLHLVAPFRALAALIACTTLAAAACGQDSLVPVPVTAERATEADALPRPVDLRPRPLGEVGSSRVPIAPLRSAPQPAGEAGPAAARSPVMQTVLSLGMVLGLILALAAGARRLARSRGSLGAALGAMGAAPSPAGILEVLGRYPVSRGSSVLLLKVDRRVLVLSQTSPGLRFRGGSASLSTLSEITDPEEVASIVVKTNEAEGRSIGTRFRDALRAFERSHDGVIEPARPSLWGRLVSRGSGGDSAELLDPGALVNDSADPLRLADFERVAKGDVVGSLRARLSALRSGGAA